MRCFFPGLTLAILISISGQPAPIPTTVLVSSFTAKQRTINPPASFTAEPMVIGNWGNKRLRFAFCYMGANGCVSKLSPYYEVNMGTDASAQAIRIPGGDRTNTAVGFLAWWNWPDDPNPANAAAFFPCRPANGQNYIFHFSPGDTRLGGQQLLADPNLGPSYNYSPNGQRFWPQGAKGLEGDVIPDPWLPPIISSHGLPIGQYTVFAAYLLPNGGETARGPPQTVTLGFDPAKGQTRAILCHRNEAVQQGVAGTVVYVQTAQGIYRSVFPRNFTTFYISRLGQPAKPPIPSPTWTSNPLVEALDSDAPVIILDTDVTVDCPVVIPYKPNITLRRIISEYKTITVAGKGELLTVNSEPHVYLEGIQFAGPSTTQGVNFCDHSGSCNFFCNFTRCNFRPGSGLWLCVDDSAGVVPNGSPLYITGHTASESFFNDCYCQREALIQGGQSVNFFFSKHRQDVGADGSLETAAMHLYGNKFISYDYFGVDNSAHSLLDISNDGGPLAIQIKNLFIDKGIPFLINKGQNEPATVELNFGNSNRESGPQAFATAPNGPLTIKLNSFIHNAPKAYGQVRAFSLDPSEAAAIQVVP